MASILRSAKFVRYVAGFARNVGINQPREFDGNLIQNTQCLCGAVQRSLANQATSQQPRPDHSLERSLRRLDQDVRRSGRISRRDIEDILEEIRQTRSASSSQSLLVIRCCGNLVPEEMPETRTRLVQEIWNTLNKLHVPMDISHYNALLRVYLENEHQFSPTEFLADLETKGIEPNRVTYQRLISRYCQLGDIEGATRILEFMREKQLPVNENVFNALIMGHSNSDDLESAKGILGVMQQAGLEPSCDTYTILLCGYARKGDIETINSILEECAAKDIYLLDKDYLDLIFAFATNGHGQHVQSMLSKVRKSVGYYQDAINLILRLINNGQEEAALEVLQTMPVNSRSEEQKPQSGNFLIRQMIKAKRPVEKLISVCKQLEDMNLHEKAFLNAAELSLNTANKETAFALFKEMKIRNLPIRQHYFWPLIVTKGKAKNESGMLETLQYMEQFGITASSETIREYIIPFMTGQADDIIGKLRSYGISIGSAATGVLYKYLMENDITEAAKIAQRIQVYYPPALFKRPLNSAFAKKNDIDSYITTIRAIYDNLDRRELMQLNQGNDDEPSNRPDKNEVIGQLVLDYLYLRPQDCMTYIEQILKGLVEQGLSMSNSTAEKIQERIGEKMTPEISSYLGRMTSGELTPVPLERSEPHYVPSAAMNIPQLERLIANLDAKGENTNGLKRQLLTQYTRAKELPKTEELLKTLKNDDFIYTSGIYAQLIDLYAHHENLEKTLYYYNKIMEIEPEMALDDSKVIKVITLMIKNNQFEQAIELLNNSSRVRKLEERSFAYVAQCWRLLNYLAEQGKDEALNILFNTLVEKEFIEANNILLGPLIKVHIVNNDLSAAIEEFARCCNKYRSTPWKNDLACKLIQCEDAEKLQRLTDLSTNIHGEVNSLYDLVFAFVECGRIRQARRILETPGLQHRSQRMNSACERYQEEGMVTNLEGLLEATRDLNHINRYDIYFQLLRSYIKKGDAEKALGLWTQLQEENMQPTDDFLSILGNFLKQKNLEVPFVMPNKPMEIPNKNAKVGISSYRNAMKTGNLDAALELKSKVSTFMTSNDYSILIEGLIQADRLNEASNVCFEMINRKMFPINRVFRYFLNKVANTGNVGLMEQIGTKLSWELKKTLSYDNRLCHANIIAGQAEAYMTKLESEIDFATSEEVPILAEKFPRGGAVGILEKCPELIQKYESLAKKYADRGVLGPMNVLWSHYFIQKNEDSANHIWKTYLENTPRIMFQRIVQLARETKDKELANRLISHLTVAKVSDGALGNAYSCLLDILASLDLEVETINVFLQATKQITLEHINHTALIRVKMMYGKAGLPFEYDIPPKRKPRSGSNDGDAQSSDSSN